MPVDRLARTTLGSLLSGTSGGGTPSRAVASYWNGAIPWASVKDFENGSIDLATTVETITPRGLASSAARVIESGIPIVCTRMAVGRCAAAQMRVAINQDLKALVPANGVSARYLLHALKHVQPWLESQGIGSTVKGISVETLHSASVWAPPLAEQCRIAEILDTLDEAIRSTEEVITKLRRMKQGLLQDLLTRGIDENGELRDPERHPEQFKGSPLGRIPTGWEVAPFERFSWLGRAFLKTGPFGSSLKGEHWVDSGVPVITIGALGEGEFIESDLLFISGRKAAELASYTVKSGDIVFSRVADVGRSVVVREREAGWVISSNLMWISLDPQRVAPPFIWLSLSSNAVVRQQIRRSVNAGGREVANGTVLRSLRLAWPDFDEQERVVAAADAFHQRLIAERANLDKLQNLKHGLMDDLLTGRVRVAVPPEAT